MIGHSSKGKEEKSDEISMEVPTAEDAGGFLAAFREETLDLTTHVDVFSLQTFAELASGDQDLPFLGLALVFSRKKEHCDERDEGSSKMSFKHLYEAKSFIEWFPLCSDTDPVSKQPIHQVDYYIFMKKTRRLFYVSTWLDDYKKSDDQNEKSQIQDEESQHHDEGSQIQDDRSQSQDGESQSQDEDSQSQERELQSCLGSIALDLFVWSYTAVDEISRRCTLASVALLLGLNLGDIPRKDKERATHLMQQIMREPAESFFDNSTSASGNDHPLSAAREIHEYLENTLPQMLELDGMECEDFNTLLRYLRYCAANFLAKVWVPLATDVEESSQDPLKLPYIATAVMTMKLHDILNLQAAGSH